MRRLLFAEFNTVYRKPKLYVLLAILIVAFALGVVIDHFVGGDMWGYQMIDIFYPFLAIILVTDITHKEYKFHTMKNLIGSGFSRKQIYFGKLIVTLGSSFAFLLVAEILKIVYAIINNHLATKIYPVAEIVDTIRCLGMFTIIFIISVLIVSDGLSLFASFVYGVLFNPIFSLAAIPLQISDKVASIIKAALLISTDAYLKIERNPKTAAITSAKIIPSGIIWCVVGIAVAVGLLILGYEVFKRKEFK
ncbi:MAG: ABC transporter permease subunit [Eubacterium sp.]|nr:ABC transporter permease subunit [Eubacterium sp.]